MLDAAYLLLLQGPKSQLSTHPDVENAATYGRAFEQHHQPLVLLLQSPRDEIVTATRGIRVQNGKDADDLPFWQGLGRVLQLSRSIASRPAEPTRTHIGSFCSTSSIQLLSSPSRNPNTSSIAVLISRNFPCWACWAR